MYIKCKMNKKLFGKIWKCNCKKHHYQIKIRDDTRCLRCGTYANDGRDIEPNELANVLWTCIASIDYERKTFYSQLHEVNDKGVKVKYKGRIINVNYENLLDIAITSEGETL